MTVIPEVYLILDIDGVLNQIAGPDDIPLTTDPENYELEFAEAWVEHPSGRNVLIRTEPYLIKKLDVLARIPGVNLVWLTPWGPSMDRLIEFAFGGILDGGEVLSLTPSGAPWPANWKLTALMRFLKSRGWPPYIWADATAIPELTIFRKSFARGDLGGRDRLLLSPPMFDGLDFDDLELIREFIATVLSIDVSELPS